MRTINNLEYPNGFAELDNFVPLNFFYNDYEYFQLCHAEIVKENAYFLLMRILESKLDERDFRKIILQKVEFMVFTSFGKNPDSTFVFDTAAGRSPIFPIASRQDADHHKADLINFQVNLVELDQDIMIPEEDHAKFMSRKVVTYDQPIVLDSFKQRLHFKVFINGEDTNLNGDTGNLGGKVCQVRGGTMGTGS